MHPYSSMYSVLFAFTLKPMPPGACSRLYGGDSAWVGIFVRNDMSSVYSAFIVVSAERLVLSFFRINRFLSIDLSTYEVLSLS